MGVYATPASDYLFKLHKDGTKMNKELAEAFYHTCTSFYLLQAEQDAISKWWYHSSLYK
jgi:hypothetical protein